MPVSAVIGLNIYCRYTHAVIIVFLYVFMEVSILVNKINKMNLDRIRVNKTEHFTPCVKGNDASKTVNICMRHVPKSLRE